jgi:hypothetical protein
LISEKSWNKSLNSQRRLNVVTTGKPAQKGPSILGAFMDFLVLVLLVCGAFGGGYYWGTIQRMAPVKAVGPGTPAALPAESTTAANSKTGTATDTAATATGKEPVGGSNPDSSSGKDPDKDKDKDRNTDKDKDKDSSTSTGESEETSPAKKKTGKVKFWVVSSGADYIGYSITVKINGTAVDSFFGGGKMIDLTQHVKSGDNKILFEAKALGEQYNKHKGDEKSVLTLQVVSGPQVVQDGFKKSDVLLTYKRNASETEDFNDTKHFTRD